MGIEFDTLSLRQSRPTVVLVINAPLHSLLRVTTKARQPLNAYNDFYLKAKT